MPLQKQIVSVSLASGVDTKTDPKQVIPGRLLALENGTLQARGKVKKRFGYAPLGNAIEGGGSITAGAGLATFQNELIEFTGTELYSYSPSIQRQTLKGTATSLEVSTTPVIRNSYEQSSPDCAFHSSGLQVFAWEDSRGGARYSVIDASTGQQIVSDLEVSPTAATPKPIAFGSYVIILYVDTATNHVSYRAISTATPSQLSASVDIALDLHATNRHYDAAVLGSRLFVSYNTSDPDGSIATRYLTTSLIVSSALTLSSESAASAINVIADSSNRQVWVAFCDGEAVKYVIKNYDLSAIVTGPIQIEGSAGRANLNFINARITFANALSLDWNTPFSISKWLRATEANAGWQFPPFIGAGSFGYFSYAAGGVVGYGSILIAASDSQFIRLDFSSIPNPGHWHSYTITYDGSGLASGITLYVDGVSWPLTVATNTLGSTSFSSSPYTLALSGGEWQNLGLYSTALSSTDASDFDAAGRTGDMTSLSSATSLTHAYPLVSNSHDVVGSLNGVDTNVQYDGIDGQVHNLAVSVVGDTGSFFYEMAASESYNSHIRTNTGTAQGNIGIASSFVRSLGLATKPFSYNGVTYLGVVYSSPLQPTYFVMNSSGDVVAKLAPSNAGGLSAKAFLPEVNQVAAGKFLFSYLEKDLLTTTTGQVYTQTGVKAGQIDFTATNTFGRTELGQNLHVSGGILAMYDGTSFVEHGFHLYPEPVTVSGSTSGGSILAGTYQYVAVYEWSDNQGQVHRSAPSIAASVTNTGSTSTNTVTIATLRLTRKQDTRAPINIVVYRTLANGSLFYQATSITSPILNNVSADTVTFTDTQADSSILGNQILYTTGGVVENIAAPAVSLIGTYKDRVVLVPSEDRSSWLYSKPVVEGAPVEFSDLFTDRINTKGSKITALAEMDDKLIFFTKTIPYFVYGDGPNSVGVGTEFAPAQPITTALTGCSNPRSVLLIPQGVIRETDKGIYLLTRGLEDIYAGADVEAYNGQAVTAAVLVPNTTQARFSLSNGTTLVYDYGIIDERGLGQWSVFTNINAVDAVVFGGQFTYLQANGQVMQETPGSYTDNGRFIKLKLLMSWLSFAGLQAFQRVYGAQILGDYASPHQLLVQVAYDFNPAFVQQTYIDAGTLLGSQAFGTSPTFGSDSVFGGPFPLYQFEVSFQQQKCETIQLSIEDLQSSNFGEGFSLSAITLEVGLKRGMNKLAATRRFG